MTNFFILPFFPFFNLSRTNTTYVRTYLCCTEKEEEEFPVLCSARDCAATINPFLLYEKKKDLWRPKRKEEIPFPVFTTDDPPVVADDCTVILFFLLTFTFIYTVSPWIPTIHPSILCILLFLSFRLIICFPTALPTRYIIKYCTCSITYKK